VSGTVVVTVVKTAPHAVEGNRSKRVTDHQITKQRNEQAASKTVGTDIFSISGRSLRENELVTIYINKNVNVCLFKALNIRKFFTDCFEILT
jgi:hypothetical protein